jgi:hypothetical protein
MARRGVIGASRCRRLLGREDCSHGIRRCRSALSFVKRHGVLIGILTPALTKNNRYYEDGPQNPIIYDQTIRPRHRKALY